MAERISQVEVSYSGDIAQDLLAVSNEAVISPEELLYRGFCLYVGVMSRLGTGESVTLSLTTEQDRQLIRLTADLPDGTRDVKSLELWPDLSADRVRHLRVLD